MTASQGSATRRIARTRSVQLAAVATVAAASALAVIGSGGSAAGAATPRAQAVGRFVDGTLGGTPIEAQLIDLKDARAQAAPNSTARNPLDAKVGGQLDVPIGDALKMPGNGVVDLGAANQIAVARTNGYAYGASGAVANTGGAELTDQPNAYPADATIDLSSAALGSAPVTIPGIPSIPGSAGMAGGPAEALGGLRVEIGALSALATTKAGGAFARPQYRISDLKLSIGSPALGALLSQLATGGTQLTGLIGMLPSAISAGSPPSSCALTAGKVPGTIDFDGGFVTLAGSSATVTVNVKKLLDTLGVHLNALPPNTDLLPYVLNHLSSVLGTGLEHVVNGVTGPLQDFGDNCLPALGPLSTVVQPVLTQLSKGQRQLEGQLTKIATKLSAAGAPLTKMANQLDQAVSIGVNVQQGAFPLPSAPQPRYEFRSPLAATPDQDTPTVDGQGVVRALEIDLASGQGAALALGTAAAGPSTAPTRTPARASAAPHQVAPNALPTGVPAGQATVGGGGPTTPLAVLAIGVLLAGVGVAGYRLRGRLHR